MISELLFSGSVVSLFILVSLIRKKDRKNLFFASCLIILWCARFSLLFLKAKLDITVFPALILIDQNLFFLDGLLLYWFAQSLAQKNVRLWIRALHLLPFFVSCLLTLQLYFSVTDTDLIHSYKYVTEALENNSYQPSWQELVFILSVILHNLIYLWLSVRKIQNYNARLLNMYSNTQPKQLQWLNKLIYSWIFCLILPLLIYFINYFTPILDFRYVEILLCCGLLSTVLFFGLHIIKQSIGNFSIDFDDSKPLLKDNENVFPHAHRTELDKLMSSQKLYRKYDLTLAQLAEESGFKPATLSKLLNQQSSNFYDFVNQHRIEEVKVNLRDSEEQIIQIAYNAGFNSKSTFNSVFKRYVGVTPSQYRKNRTSE